MAQYLCTVQQKQTIDMNIYIKYKKLILILGLITEPYASDQAKVIDIENVTSRYRFFLENPGSFEAARRIVDRARGREI